MKKLPDAIEWHISFREDKSKKEVEYLSKLIKRLETLHKKKYRTLLEVACGNGRLHPFLRKNGFIVFGIDNSKELIREAKKRQPRFSNNYFLADMRSFEIKKKFDIVLSWFTSFGYFDDKENIKVLREMKRHLKKDGLIIIDIPNRDIKRYRKRRRTYTQRYGKYIEIVFNRMVRIRGQTFWVLVEKFYVKDGKLRLIREIKRRVRMYNPEEIRCLLSDAELNVVDIFRNKTFNKIRKNSRRMLIVAKNQ